MAAATPVKAFAGACAAAVVGAAMLAGCVAAFPVPLPASARIASGQTIGASAFAGPWDEVLFEMNSWGQPVTSWRLQSDGSGNWTRAERGAGVRPDDHQLTSHQINADEASVSRLQGLIEALPLAAPKGEDCVSFIADQPYGTLSLVKGSSTLVLAYNTGCRDDAYEAFLDQLRAADALVSRMSEQSPLLRRGDPATTHNQHGE